jgi:hypothetical protein
MKKLHQNQQAYKAGKSVDTALHQLVVRAENALDQQEIGLSVVLVIKWAFNYSSYDSMCTVLTRHGLDCTIV